MGRDSLILVPPLLERDHRGRSRMTKSSFDIQFSKLQLKWLFNDYLWPDATSLLRFSPPEDKRITAKARFAGSVDRPTAGATGALAVPCRSFLGNAIKAPRDCNQGRSRLSLQHRRPSKPWRVSVQSSEASLLRHSLISLMQVCWACASNQTLKNT